MADRDLSLCAARECCISASVHWPQDPLMSSPSWRHVVKTPRKEPDFNFSAGATFFGFPALQEWSASGRVWQSEIPSPFTGGLLACALCTHTLRNVLGILFSTQAVWPHAKWRQHSSCYRSASVRVVMVAAHKSRYLPSERKKNVKNCHSPRSEAHSHTAEWVELAHRDCTSTPFV